MHYQMLMGAPSNEHSLLDATSSDQGQLAFNCEVGGRPGRLVVQADGTTLITRASASGQARAHLPTARGRRVNMRQWCWGVATGRTSRARHATTTATAIERGLPPSATASLLACLLLVTACRLQSHPRRGCLTCCDGGGSALEEVRACCKYWPVGLVEGLAAQLAVGEKIWSCLVSAA